MKSGKRESKQICLIVISSLKKTCFYHCLVGKQFNPVVLIGI